MRWLPEALVIGLLTGIGLYGWLASIEAQLAPLQSAFTIDADRYLDRVEQELVSTRDALERKIADSRQQGTDTIDRDALNRHIDHDTQHPELGKAELATPTYVDENAPLAALPASRNLLKLGALQQVSTTAPRVPTLRNDGAHSADSDLFAYSTVRNSIAIARDSGHAVLYLAPDPVTTSELHRTGLFAPIYAIDTPWSIRDRRSQFSGVVYSPLDIVALLSRVSRDFPELSVAVRTGDRLFIGDTARRNSDATRIQAAKQLATRTILGQTIDFDIGPAATAASAIDSSVSTLWLLQTALAMTLLLSILVYRYRSSRVTQQELLEHSSQMTSRVKALERDNANLESFAYVVSHDLKTPLRKMQALTDVLADDLDRSDGCTIDSDDVDECLRRMHDQVSCMDTLINGILDYSSANGSENRVETIDTRATIESVTRSIGISTDQLQLHGEFPTIRTWPVRYEQTLANLIGNAFKYHDRPEEARIEISVSGFGNFYLFSVRDDGPGIDPTDHERIFEVFESIRTPGVESSGVGLSIVRKAVESVGGRLSLDSTPGAGAVFRFTWPKNIDNSKPTNKAAE